MPFRPIENSVWFGTYEFLKIGQIASQIVIDRYGVFSRYRYGHFKKVGIGIGTLLKKMSVSVRVQINLSVSVFFFYFKRKICPCKQ